MRRHLRALVVDPAYDSECQDNDEQS